MATRDIRWAYEILGVPFEASASEVRQAYRDLIAVWHPDRFHSNPRLRDRATQQVTSAWMRYPTGAFSPGSSGDAFRPLSGVLWLELKGATALERDYHLFLNPNALVPVPTDVIGAIKGVMDSWSPPFQEQDSSIDELPPEARRLFGLE